MEGWLELSWSYGKDSCLIYTHGKKNACDDGGCGAVAHAEKNFFYHKTLNYNDINMLLLQVDKFVAKAADIMLIANQFSLVPILHFCAK